MYLIYDTEDAAIERADEEGKYHNFSYWTKGKGTRWLTAPIPTAEGKWALDVTGYDLDELEESTATLDVTFPQPTEDLV